MGGVPAAPGLGDGYEGSACQAAQCLARGYYRSALQAAPGFFRGCYGSACQAAAAKVLIRFFLAYYNRRSAFGGVKMVAAQSVSASSHEQIATDLSVFTKRDMRIGGRSASIYNTAEDESCIQR